MLAVVRRLWSRFLRISHRRDKTCFFSKTMPTLMKKLARKYLLFYGTVFWDFSIYLEVVAILPSWFCYREVGTKTI
ncbi:unnamed protein product [Brassica rapa]|uniref:Uncharacterized protein n=1 Tax=Brassica campestris TaxID=3711 RepID=A0A8D9HAQ5_BRACM|nr:unnamed protein product [Brassica rapa]